VVYLVDVYDKERFVESRKEFDALLSNVRSMEVFICSIVWVMVMVSNGFLNTSYSSLARDDFVYHFF